MRAGPSPRRDQPGPGSPPVAAEGSYVNCAVTHSGLRGRISLAKAETTVHHVSTASPRPLAAPGRCVGSGVRLTPRLSGTEGRGRGSRPCGASVQGAGGRKNAFPPSVPIQGHCSWPEARCFPTVSWARGRTNPKAWKPLHSPSRGRDGTMGQLPLKVTPLLSFHWPDLVT